MNYSCCQSTINTNDLETLIAASFVRYIMIEFKLTVLHDLLVLIDSSAFVLGI
jgi:hypothetical protein